MTTTALITGATSGIGGAAADKLAQSGVHVMVVGRNAERGERTIAEIRAAGGKADFIASDLRDAASARAVASKAVALGGGQVDILINNAGVFPFGLTHETSEQSFDDVYALNVKVPYFLVAELAPLMAQRGTGAIVNVSTMVADYGAAGMSLYGSSKAAINLLTKAWAAEYGPKGVRVNAVSPGPTRTEGTAAMGDALQQLAAQAPAGRPAAPEEIAEAIVFLATTEPVSSRARFCRSMAAGPPYRFMRGNAWARFPARPQAGAVPASEAKPRQIQIAPPKLRSTT
jgi:NAD(P)-dependent dehydrogenase (short-subunit alcohol dehydrogenase family)